MTAIDPMVELESWMVSLDLPFDVAPLLDHPAYAVLCIEGAWQLVVHIPTALDCLRATTRDKCDRAKGLVLLDAIQPGVHVRKTLQGWQMVRGYLKDEQYA